MAKWNVGMKDEGGGGRTYLPDGEHKAVIEKVEMVNAETSKSGNPYFKWELKTSAGTLKVNTTLIKGKRWLLKQMLAACGVVAKSDDPAEKYNFGEEDVVGKEITVRIKNKTSSFTGREGDEISFEKSEVVGVIALTEEVDDKNEIPF